MDVFRSKMFNMTLAKNILFPLRTGDVCFCAIISSHQSMSGAWYQYLPVDIILLDRISKSVNQLSIYEILIIKKKFTCNQEIMDFLLQHDEHCIIIGSGIMQISVKNILQIMQQMKIINHCGWMTYSNASHDVLNLGQHCIK